MVDSGANVESQWLPDPGQASGVGFAMQTDNCGLCSDALELWASLFPAGDIVLVSGDGTAGDPESAFWALCACLPFESVCRVLSPIGEKELTCWAVPVSSLAVDACILRRGIHNPDIVVGWEYRCTISTLLVASHSEG
jgi:hypothetical protein